MNQSARLASAAASRTGRYRRLPIIIGTLALLPTLTACFLTRDELDPALEVPKSYHAAHGSPDAAPPPPDWWRSFRSSELTDLMEQAQVANLDIAVAVAQIAEADAQARIAGAALLPILDATANVQHSQSSIAAGGIGQVTTLYTPAMNASYTLDFWGHNQALLQAAEHSAVASRFAREVVALTTFASVANAYFLVLEGQDRIGIAKKNLASAEDTLKLIQDRFNQGTAAALDVAQQASLTAIQRASIPPLIEQVQQNTAALALLLGRAPSGFRVKGGSMSKLAIPRVTPGLPSELLQRRPDVRQAEAQLAAANANVDAARTAFFPTIQLTGQAGFESVMLRTLFGPGATFYTLTAGLTQPIFDATLPGQLDLQKGTREQLLQAYRKSVTSAFTDVEKALIAVEQTTRQEQLERDAVKESQRAFDLSQDKLHAGTIDLTTLLTVEQTLFTQQDTLAQDRFARLEALIALYQALGGGWLPDVGDKEARAASH